MNAQGRGLNKIIQATLEDAALRPESFGAAGTFDVIEHIKDDMSFLKSVHRLLRVGGKYYGTVPAHPALWSDEDDAAGHFRRYQTHTLRTALEQGGFEVEFVSPFFSWLVVPIALARSLPYRVRGRANPRSPSARTIRSDHTLPSGLSAPVRSIHAWELRRLRARRAIPLGSSLLWVARRR